MNNAIEGVEGTDLKKQLQTLSGMQDLAEYNQEGKKDPSSVNEALLKS